MGYGHEQSGPYSKAEAVKLCEDHGDRTCNTTLIGPDGQIYAL